MNSICVFCGSNAGVFPGFRAAAADLGRLLALRNLGLVYGGGRVGLMGVLADAALSNDGRVIGVMPQALVEKEIAHAGLTTLHVVESMHERKALMADLASAFILLPGGFGSWEEFFEIVTWAQLGIHRKPCGLLNVGGYYDALIALAERAVDEGFVRAAHRDMVVVDDDPERLLDRMASSAIPVEVKWARADER